MCTPTRRNGVAVFDAIYRVFVTVLCGIRGQGDVLQDPTKWKAARFDEFRHVTHNVWQESIDSVQNSWRRCCGRAETVARRSFTHDVKTESSDTGTSSLSRSCPSEAASDEIVDGVAVANGSGSMNSGGEARAAAVLWVTSPRPIEAPAIRCRCLLSRVSSVMMRLARALLRANR